MVSQISNVNPKRKFQWNELEEDSEKFIPLRLQNFSATPGILKEDLLLADDPMVFYREFFNYQFFENVALLTNAYAEKAIQEGRLKNTTKNIEKFEPTDAEEIQAFSGLNYLLGLTQKNSLYEFWYFFSLCLL